ncbi:SDR family oxidoreductase [Castellaniella sp. GW247-6E4]|uniref:SDR family oxidoreductase n=1 Tax=Castellaniella sp. GW247-6E4 TaxID=3140380 RepID=UPI0033151978
MSGFSGSKAVVTGAARGIGLAVARALSSAGAHVALFDRDQAALSLAAEGFPGDVFCRALDTTRGDEVDAAVGAFAGEDERIDMLVNCAGIQRLGPLVELSEDDFAATFSVNVMGTFLVTQAVARRMIPARRGAVVTVSSNAARAPRVKQGAYCASKAAVSHLMRVFGLELAAYGIRCNSIDPGATETDMIRDMVRTMGIGDLLLKGSLESFRVGTPLGKNAQVEDVANAVLFLLSEQAGHITMHDLVVDGGATLGA